MKMTRKLRTEAEGLLKDVEQIDIMPLDKKRVLFKLSGREEDRTCGKEVTRSELEGEVRGRRIHDMG